MSAVITLNMSKSEAFEYLMSKATPMKGLRTEGLEEYYNSCPRCESLVSRNDSYCPKCGQKVEFVDFTESRNPNKESVETDEKTAEIENMSRTEPSKDDIIPFDSDEF